MQVSLVLRNRICSFRSLERSKVRAVWRISGVSTPASAVFPVCSWHLGLTAAAYMWHIYMAYIWHGWLTWPMLWLISSHVIPILYLFYGYFVLF